MRALPTPDTPVNELVVSSTPHGLSIGALVAAAMGWLPAIVAVIPAIYYLILIFESKTVQGWLERRRQRKAAIKAAVSQAMAKVDAQTAKDLDAPVPKV